MTSELAPPRLDRPWLPAAVVTVLGPLAGLTTARVNHRWSELVAVLPAGSWLRRFPEPVATEVDDSLLEDAAMRAAVEPWTGPPVRVLVGGGSVAVLYSHAVGDGRSSRRLVHDLLTEPGSPLTFPLLRPVSWGRLALAAARLWSPSPGRVRSVVAGVRERRALAPYEGEVEPALLYRCVDPDALASLQVERDHDRPAASTSFYLLERFVTELARRGIDLGEVTVPVDLRRYLQGGEHLGGNLAGVQWLPADPATLADRWQAALRSGEPFAFFLAAHAHRALSRSGVHTRAGLAAPNLGWSDRGRVTEWDDLPWAGGPRRMVAGVVPVWGARIGIHLSRVGGALHIACAINAAALEPERVGAALDACLVAVRHEEPA